MNSKVEKIEKEVGDCITDILLSYINSDVWALSWNYIGHSVRNCTKGSIENLLEHKCNEYEF